MKKILIATHGNLAEGALSSLKIIAGEIENITYINAFTEEKNIDKALLNYFSTCNEEDQIIVLTDIFGGSVNQAAIKFIPKGNVFLITGFNLALLLEIAMMNPEENVDEEKIKEIIKNSQKQIMFVNDVINSTTEEDFFD